MYISIILGILLSIIFFYFIKSRDILIIRGESIDNIKKNNISKNGRCYNIVTEETNC